MLENSSSAAWRAKTSDSPGSTPIPTSASTPASRHSSLARELVVAEHLARQLVGRSGCGRDSVIAMSR